MVLNFNDIDSLVTFQEAVKRMTIDEVKQQACDRLGILNKSVSADGQFHRTDVLNSHAGNGNASIKIFSDGQGGLAYNWQSGEKSFFWLQSDENLTPEERLARQQRQELEQANAEAERNRRYALKAELSQKVYEAALPVTSHDYLDRKQVQPTSIIRCMGITELARLIGYTPKGRDGNQQLTGDILVCPVSDFSNMTSLELIDVSGNKTALAGSRRKGCFCPVNGFPGSDSKGLTVLIGEGIATVLSGVQALSGSHGVAALGCSNLKAVALAWRERYPLARVVILSDVGRGERDAVEAAKAAGALLFKPNLPSGVTGSDANDLHCNAGLNELAKQLQAVLESEAAHDKPAYTTKNLKDLFYKEIPPIRWVVPGLIPEGLAVLAGSPKIGKSWLALDLCIAIARGGHIWGKFPTAKGEALLLCLEDNDRRMQDRVRKRTEYHNDLEGVHYSDQWQRLDQQGVENLDHFLTNHPKCGFVVIDTAQKVKPKQKSRGNSYEADYDTYGGLQRLALKHRACVMLIHHNRKQGSQNENDALEEISGSTGLTGSADTVMMLKRARLSDAAELHITGRDIEEAKYAMTFDKQLCGWSVAFDISVEELNRKPDGNPAKVLQAIKALGGSATVSEIYEYMDHSIKRDTIKITCHRMKNDGGLDKFGNIYVIPSSQRAADEKEVSDDIPADLGDIREVTD